MRKEVRDIALLLTGLGTVLATYWFYFEYRQESAYALMSVGDSRQKLIENAGEPTYVTDGTRWVEPQHKRAESEVIPGCRRELWYRAKYLPIPSKWSYCFDEQERLLQKYHWVSW